MLIKTTVRWLKMIGLISLKHMPDFGIIQWIFLLDVKWPLDRNLRIQESTDQSWTTEGNNISKQKLEKGAHCSSLGLTWIQGNCATTAWTRYIYGAATWSSHPNFLKIQPLSSPKNTSSAPSPAISGVRRVTWLKQSDQKRRNSCPNSQHISFPGGFFLWPRECWEPWGEAREGLLSPWKPQNPTLSQWDLAAPDWGGINGNDSQVDCYQPSQKS